MYYEPWMNFKCYHCSIPTCCADLNNYPMDLRWPTNSYVGFFKGGTLPRQYYIKRTVAIIVSLKALKGTNSLKIIPCLPLHVHTYISITSAYGRWT